MTIHTYTPQSTAWIETLYSCSCWKPCETFEHLILKFMGVLQVTTPLFSIKTLENHLSQMHRFQRRRWRSTHGPKWERKCPHESADHKIFFTPTSPAWLHKACATSSKRRIMRNASETYVWGECRDLKRGREPPDHRMSCHAVRNCLQGTVLQLAFKSYYRRLQSSGACIL